MWPRSFDRGRDLKPTKATYVFEKDAGSIPPGVAVALDNLNRQGILATAFEDNTIDGTGEVPEQYKIALDAARLGGPLPVLIVQSGDEVLSITKSPLTEADVMEAVAQ